MDRKIFVSLLIFFLLFSVGTYSDASYRLGKPGQNVTVSFIDITDSTQISRITGGTCTIRIYLPNNTIIVNYEDMTEYQSEGIYDYTLNENWTQPGIYRSIVNCTKGSLYAEYALQIYLYKNTSYEYLKEINETTYDIPSDVWSWSIRELTDYNQSLMWTYLENIETNTTRLVGCLRDYSCTAWYFKSISEEINSTTYTVKSTTDSIYIDTQWLRSSVATQANISDLETKLDNMQSNVTDLMNRTDCSNSTLLNVSVPNYALCSYLYNIDTNVTYIRDNMALQSTLLGIGTNVSWLVSNVATQSNVSDIHTKLDTIDTNVDTLITRTDCSVPANSVLCTYLNQINTTVYYIRDNMALQSSLTGIGSNVSYIKDNMVTQTMFENNMTVLRNRIGEVNTSTTTLLSRTDCSNETLYNLTLSSYALCSYLYRIDDNVIYVVNNMATQTNVSDIHTKLDNINTTVKDTNSYLKNQIVNKLSEVNTTTQNTYSYLTVDIENKLDEINSTVHDININTTSLNKTVSNIWEQMKRFDYGNIVNETITNAILNTTNNITIDYNLTIPQKEGYNASEDYFPAKIHFWFISSTTGKCVNQAGMQEGVAHPYCNPLTVQIVGKVNETYSFEVELSPSLPIGNYSIVREVSVDPPVNNKPVWRTYSFMEIGTVEIQASRWYPSASVAMQKSWFSIWYIIISIVFACSFGLIWLFRRRKREFSYKELIGTIALVFLLLPLSVHADNVLAPQIRSSDTEDPVISGVKVYPASSSYTTTLECNATVTDNVGVSEVILQFDGTNYTNSSNQLNVSGNEYYKDFTFATATTHTYKWYANDTTNNWDSTSLYSVSPYVAPTQPGAIGGGIGGAICGNDICEAGESWVNCLADCPKPAIAITPEFFNYTIELENYIFFNKSFEIDIGDNEWDIDILKVPIADRSYEWVEINSSVHVDKIQNVSFQVSITKDFSPGYYTFNLSLVPQIVGIDSKNIPFYFYIIKKTSWDKFVEFLGEPGEVVTGFLTAATTEENFPRVVIGLLVVIGIIAFLIYYKVKYLREKEELKEIEELTTLKEKE